MTRQQKIHWALIGLVLISLSVVVILAKSHSDYWQQAEHYGAYLQSAGLLGMLAVLLAASLGIAVGLPRQLFAFVLGFAYGTLPGFAVALLSAVMGCALTYSMARYVFSKRFKNRYPAIKTTLAQWVEEDLFLKLVILRFQPLGTNMVTNVCAGLVPVPARVFFAGSTLGFVPQTLVFAMLGAGVRLDSTVQVWVSLGLLLISIVLALVVYRRAA